MGFKLKVLRKVNLFLHLFEKQAERERETDRQTVMKRDGQAGMVSTGSLSKCPQWPGGWNQELGTQIWVFWRSRNPNTSCCLLLPWSALTRSKNWDRSQGSDPGTAVQDVSILISKTNTCLGKWCLSFVASMWDLCLIGSWNLWNGLSGLLLKPKLRMPQ